MINSKVGRRVCCSMNMRGLRQLRVTGWIRERNQAFQQRQLLRTVWQTRARTGTGYAADKWRCWAKGTDGRRAMGAGSAAQGRVRDVQGVPEPGHPGPPYSPCTQGHLRPPPPVLSQGLPGARQMSKVTTRASWSGGTPTAPHT